VFGADVVKCYDKHYMYVYLKVLSSYSAHYTEENVIIVLTKIFVK